MIDESNAAPLSSLRDTSIQRELLTKTSKHSVVISPTADLRSGGSGTLIKYKEIWGILTATHVMAKHIDAKDIYAPIDQTHNPAIALNRRIPIKRLIYLETPAGLDQLRDPAWPSSVLDICLIELNRDTVDFLLSASGKEVIDLDFQKKKYDEHFEHYCCVDNINNWFYTLCGAPREGVHHNSNQIVESEYDGPYFSGGYPNTTPLIEVQSGFDRDVDLITHNIGPTKDRLPSKYEGLSGGGAWQVSLGGNNGMPSHINELFFSGVVVCASRIEIKSRGPESLYSTFLPFIDQMNT